MAVGGSTRIPSWEFPKPHSSSAQIIPSDTSPRILAFWMVKGSLPGMWMVVPTVAIITFCPAATLGAPHTMLLGWLSPMFTVVRDNLSALGCLVQVSTSPTTNPSRLIPPG